MIGHGEAYGSIETRCISFYLITSVLLLFSQKTAEWQRIEPLFNARSTYLYRSADALSSKWDNLKKNAKKNHAESKKHTYGTGGGPRGKRLSALDLRVLAILNTKAVGLQAEFGDDITVSANSSTATTNSTNSHPLMAERRKCLSSSSLLSAWVSTN